MAGLSLGLPEALRLTLEALSPLPPRELPLLEAVGMVAASDLTALVDSPRQASSRKDGYAVISHEVAQASPQNPVGLRLLGRLSAGEVSPLAVEPGGTVRVLTGAAIPPGADAVVSEEFARPDGERVWIEIFADTAKNILPAGGDVAAGQPVLRAGEFITPQAAGLLAAAGYHLVPVHPAPLVGILGTGSEIVAPGQPLAPGKLYASNIVTLAAFCRRYGLPTRLDIVKDVRSDLRQALASLAAQSDALITSGGAWRGDHDYVAQELEALGWRQVFHRIRMGPGKAVGLGLLNGKPVFVLPGGPPSNLMGFLQIALPGLLAMCGWRRPGLPTVQARLAKALGDGKAAWSDFFFGLLEPGLEQPLFHPLPKRARLTAIATANAVGVIPEGLEELPAGAAISVQPLS